MKKQTENPFVIQGYQGKDYFCDREKELALLREHVLNKRNFTLYGWRRLGKTALLRCLGEILENRHQFQTLLIDIAACRNIQELTVKTVDTVYQRFGKTRQGIKHSFRKLIGSLGLSMGFDAHTGMPHFSLGVTTPPGEKPSLQAIMSFLGQQKAPVLIVFDEFQQVNHFHDEGAEAILRELSQSFPNLRFAFSGSHRGIMQYMFTSHKRPFYKSTQLVDLQPIDHDVYIPFITQKFKEYQKIIPKSLASDIYHWCRGETYSVQVICNRLFSKYKKPDQSDFMTVTNELLLEQKRAYTEWLNLLPYTQVQVLKAIAKAEPVSNPTSQSFISKFKLGATSSVQTALKGLLEKEIIFKENDQYWVHDVLFGKWLKTL